VAESAKGKWARVHSALRRRRLPSRQDIIDAPRMGDPKMGPPEIQAHIAALLAGEVGARRGPRQKPFDQVLFEDEYLIRRVDRARQEFKAKGARAAQQLAFAQVAPEFGWQDGDTASTMYRRAKRTYSRLPTPTPRLNRSFARTAGPRSRGTINSGIYCHRNSKGAGG
jgi:hypothetical protein